MNIFRNKPLIITVVVLAVLIVLVAATASSNTISQKTTIAGSAFVPFQKFFYGISGPADGGEAIDTAKAEQLQHELAEYKGKVMDYDELLAENQRLSSMLEYKQNHEGQELKVASITGKEPSNWFDVFTIDLGAKDGVKEDMPVITPDGLVGRVEEVGLNWSKVIGIIDGRSKVSAIMERTRDVGVVDGKVGTDGLAVTLTMNFLPIGADVVEGDLVITSGLDGIYPKGLIIGTVTSTTSETGGVQVRIDPAVDFRRLEEVMVVVKAEETKLVVDEDIADESAVASALPDETDAGGNEGAADDGESAQDDAAAGDDG